MKVAIVVASDRASRGEYEDLSGAVAVRRVLEAYPTADTKRMVVSDEPAELATAFREAVDWGAQFIISSGGTGIGPRDNTPEVTRAFCDRELPGIAEAIRAESLKETASAQLSRGMAGMAGTVIVVNLPGSVNAVETGLRVFLPIMSHALRMVEGGDHGKH
jgi:molybdenum cofactor synthesis domain-containing protein